MKFPVSRYTRSLESQVAKLEDDLATAKTETTDLRRVNADLNQKIFDLRVKIASTEPIITDKATKQPRSVRTGWMNTLSTLESHQGEISEAEEN